MNRYLFISTFKNRIAIFAVPFSNLLPILSVSAPHQNRTFSLSILRSR